MAREPTLKLPALIRLLLFSSLSLKDYLRGSSCLEMTTFNTLMMKPKRISFHFYLILN